MQKKKKEQQLASNVSQSNRRWAYHRVKLQLFTVHSYRDARVHKLTFQRLWYLAKLSDGVAFKTNKVDSLVFY